MRRDDPSAAKRKDQNLLSDRTPAVSVLLPCYNATAHLDECLESLVLQTFDDFEIVAVDDGSEDDTLDSLREHGRADSRIRVLGKPHRGIAETLRAAVEESRAPLFARMDTDDICHPERFALQVSFLREHPDVDVVGSGVRLFPREGLKEGLLRYESWVNATRTHEMMLRDLFVESPLPHPSVMMKRRSLERVGGYRDKGWPEDYDLWMRMAHAGCRFAKVPEVLLHWRDWPDRASRTDDSFSSESFLDLKEHYLLETRLKGCKQVAIWGAGPVGKRWALRLRKRDVEVTHFVDLDPRKIGKRIHGAEVIAAGDVIRLRGRLILVAVGALSRERDLADDPWLSARSEIREQLDEAGFTEGDDYLCIA